MMNIVHKFTAIYDHTERYKPDVMTIMLLTAASTVAFIPDSVYETPIDKRIQYNRL